MKTLLLVVDLAGTFVFALSGALAGVERRLDVVDVLLAQVPTVLRADLYAVAALAGAAVVVLGDIVRIPPSVAMVVGFVVCFGLRLMAIRRGWRLPTPP